MRLAGPSTGLALSNLVWINNVEIAVASSAVSGFNVNKAEIGVWVYNTITNEWRLDVKFPNDFKTRDNDICYNPKTKILWLYCKYNNMVNINMETKQFKIIKSDARNVGMWPKLLFIDDQLHVIGGSRNKCHLIWNQNEKKFDPPIFTFDEWKNGVYGHGAVFVKKKRIVYVFGGYNFDGVGYLFTFWKCEVDKGYEWTKLAITAEIKMYYRAYMLTSDERYIVIFGAKKVCLLDTNEEKCHYYDSELMYASMNSGLLSSSNKNIFVVGGYIRNVVKEFDMIIPVDVIGIIETYYNIDMVYLLDSNSQRFYHVLLDDVLNVQTA